MTIRILFLFLFSLAPFVLWGASPKLLNTQIPMRDGRFLGADILVPAGRGPFPTIYIHTPYNKDHITSLSPDSPFLPELSARDRYVYVITDWRGYFSSQAAAVPKPDHGKDGYDAIEWIARQPWSDGRVGMWGHSAVGAVQFRIALERPPHLVCMVPASAHGGLRYSQFFYGGVLQELYAQTLTEVGHGWAGKVLSHRRKDWFWKRLEKNADGIYPLDLPMLLVTGWYDTHPRLKIEAFSRLKTPGKKHLHAIKLMIGPWHHTAFGRSKQGDSEFPEAESAGSRQTLRFFDYYLRGKTDNGWDQVPDLQYFQMGENAWKCASSWTTPPLSVTYFVRQGGKLSLERPKAEPADAFEHRPKDPVPTVGGPSLIAVRKGAPVEPGPKDLREKIESRNDVLIYRTEPLSGDLSVRGVIEAKLWVSTTGRDTDLAVRVSDLFPDGRSLLVTDGIWRLSYRDSLRFPKLRPPRATAAVTVPLEITAYTFRRGHRLLLVISSSNAPKYEVYPEPATNRLFHDGAHASHLVLPTDAAQ